MSNFSVQSAAICQRIPFWLNEKDDAIFCWLHLPNDNKIKSMGAVICNPLGYEYSHSHRSLRHLADQLAAAGFPSLRFDYHGTGDSFSDLLAENRIQTFLQNIEQVIEQLKILTGVTKVSLIGLRLGATLAAAYAKNHAVDNLILWSPYAKGRAYVREMKALEQLASHASEHKNSFIDSGGFIVSDETAENLSDINLLKQNYNTENILLIERDDLQPNQKLFDTLSKNTLAACSTQSSAQSSTTQSNEKVEQFSMSGYLTMMEEPQQTIVPQSTINKIIDWHNCKLDSSSINDIDSNPIESNQINQFNQLATTTKINESSYQETLVQQEQSFGVLTLPTSFEQTNYNKPIVILCNSGSVHRIGPNRVYVELARALVESGFAVYRFDLRQLGDSVKGILTNENNPYSYEAVGDLENAIKLMRDNYGFSEFVISGLCSGAHNTFHAGLILADKYNIKEAIIINPLTFYKDIEASQAEYAQDNFSELNNQSGNEQLKSSNTNNTIDNFQVETDAKQYRQSLLDPKKWLKLISGKVDIGYLTKFIFQKSLKTFTTTISNIGMRLGLTDGDQLSIDLKKYESNHLKISFFIASKDPGKAILMSQSKNTVNRMIKSQALNLYEVPDADHTFSSYQCRNDFVNLYKKHLVKNYTE